MSNDTVISIILTVIIIAIILFFALRGWRKGFLRVLFSTFQVVIIAAVSMALTAPLANYLEETSLGERIYTQTLEFIDSKADSLGLTYTDENSESYTAPDIDDDSASGLIDPDEGGSGLSDIDEDAAEGLIDSDEESTGLPDIDKDTAKGIIDSLGMPTVIKELLTSDDFAGQQLSAFEEDLAEKLTSLILRALSFIILAILTFILIRLIRVFTKFINKIPVIGGINRLLGLILGIAQVLIILWIAAIAVMIFSATEGGSHILAIIQGNAFLNLIYDNNLLLQLAASVFTSG